MTETEAATVARLRDLASVKGLTVTCGVRNSTKRLCYRVCPIVRGPWPGAWLTRPAIHDNYLTARNAERAIAAYQPAPDLSTAVARWNPSVLADLFAE